MAQKYSISFKIVKVYSLNERDDDVFFVLLSFFSSLDACGACSFARTLPSSRWRRYSVSAKKEMIFFVLLSTFRIFVPEKEKCKMSRIFSLWSAICRFKYWVVLAIIVLIVGFVDDNSFWNRHKRQVVLSQLSAEIASYKEQYENDDRRLKELDENPIALEKLAREKYHMKRDNEDLFIVLDETAEQTSAEADSVQAW